MHVFKQYCTWLALVFLISCTSTQNRAHDHIGYVFHASPVQKLKVIKAQKSTHLKSWVYAKFTPEEAAPFLAKWGDFDIALGACSEGDIEFIVERYPSAFEKVFADKKGSIYKLRPEGFSPSEHNKTEWVKNSDANVVQEIKISNVAIHIKDLEDNGKDRKSTRLNSSHLKLSRMPSSA